MAIQAEVLLINAEYFKKYTHTNDSVDQNLLNPSIYLAQDKYLQGTLGTKLLQYLKDNIASLPADYQTLLDNYVRRAVCWWTMVEVLPHLTYKLDNGTLVQRTSEDASPIDNARMKDFMDKAQSNARFYTERLDDYLCANSSLFPEYQEYENGDIAPRPQRRGESTILFSNGNTASSRERSGEQLLNRYLPR